MSWVPHNRVTPPPSGGDRVAEAVEQGKWAQGPFVAELEGRLSALAGGRHAVCAASGTAALRLALQSLGVGEGDEVIVPAYACVALPNAAMALGATAVVAEVEDESWTLSLTAVDAVRTNKTKAAIAVHALGLQADIEALKGSGILVIEDCAHALGRGSFGQAGTLSIGSFYATKLIGAGEGGVIFCDDADTADALRIARDYTDRAAGGERLNEKMTDLSAALCLAQLDDLPNQLAKRDALAERYATLLEPLASAGMLALPSESEDRDRIWYRYAVTLNAHKAGTIEAEMETLGIGVAQPVWDWVTSSGHALPPVAKRAYDHVLSLPLYPSLSETEQDRVVAALGQCLKRD